MFTRTKPARRPKTSPALLAMGVLAGLYSNAAAMRCGTELIDDGDTQRDVALKCGEPTVVDQNRWIYDVGPHSFVKILHFRGGEVHLIENGRHGDTGRWPSTPTATP